MAQGPVRSLRQGIVQLGPLNALVRLGVLVFGFFFCLAMEGAMAGINPFFVFAAIDDTALWVQNVLAARALGQ